MSKKDYRALNKSEIDQMKPELRSAEEVLAELRTHRESGLSSDEVIMRQAIFGLNVLKEKPKGSVWEQIIEQFTDPMVRLLLIAAVISFGISCLSDSREADDLPAWLEPLVIVLIIVFNSLVGIYQDAKAEKSVESLKKLQSKKSLALRNGEWNEIDSAFLVPGDILKVRVGDVVPADCRVLRIMSSDLRVDEAIITGESQEIGKTTEVTPKGSLQERACVLLSGTTVLFGYCIAVVVHTGNTTVLGSIMTNVEEAEEDTKDVQTPLKKQLNEFAEHLAKIIGIICIVIWVFNFPKFFDKVHGNWLLGALYYFKQAVALGVAAIPEGLPAVITTCLSLGTLRMVRKNALVVTLSKVETLGCTTVICSDKTGTLTMNKMFASKIVTIGGDNKPRDSSVTGQGYNPEGDVVWNSSLIMSAPNHSLLALNCLLNNESKILSKDDQFQCIGLPTEGALLSLGKKLAKSTPTNDRDFETLFTLSFSSLRKRMSVLVRDKKAAKNVLFTKGNPGIVLKSCSDFMNSEGKIVPIDAAFNATVETQIKQLADSGLRVLALAYKESDRMGVLRDLGSSEDILSPAYRYLKDVNNYNFIESDLTFLGLVGISDPVRPEAKSALQVANAAGISVFMITGDIPETAVAIAKDLEMIPRESNSDAIGKGSLTTRALYTPTDFDLLSETQRQSVLRSAIDAKRSLIFARATPQFKRVIVKTLTGMNEIVAMTGDGVNDAPALKQSSIGISMGITGTEVAKEASDLILLDDNFSTIVTAVEEGRSIYANMKAFIRYMISSNIGEVVSIFLQSLLGIPEGFNSIQLLWVNLVTDGLPATALSFNPVDIDIMTKPPRKSTDRIVDDWTLKRYLVIGTYVGIATVGIFIYYYVFYTSPNSTHTLISFWELRNWTKCEDWKGVVFRGFEANPCDYFITGKRKASTMSLTVLTIIEMFNAVNALSENQSILTIGFFSNVYLLQAIVLSVALHCVILYVPFFNTLFSVVPLDIYDWGLVVAFSFPVVIIEEYLKKLTRERKVASHKLKAD